jgi:integrase
MAINLTEKTIQKLRKQPGRHRDQLVKGLLLVVSGPNSAAWTLRYQVGAKERWAGLGGLRDTPLAAARERARQRRLMLFDGKDPLDEKKAAKAARRADALRSMSFRQAAESFIQQHSAKWRNAAHAAQWANSLRDYAYPILGDLPVAAVDVVLVLKCLEQQVEADVRYSGGQFWKVRHETASRVRGRIEAVLDWATARQHRVGDNPASWKTIGKVLPASTGVPQEHFSAMPWADLPAFVAELRTHTGAAARCLEFTILTAARSGEVIGARWSEIDFDGKTWTVPAERMKAQREHRVPLTPEAIALLRSLYSLEGDNHIFIGVGPKSMRRQLLQMGRDCSVHGFRSSFRDWAGEQTGFPHDVCEAALAHSRGAVERAYARGDLFVKRRKLMESWSAYLASPSQATGDVIVPLRAKSN